VARADGCLQKTRAGLAAELLTIQEGGHGSGAKPEEWAGAVVKSVEFFSRRLKSNR
jgi:hypothetical protein